METRRGMPAGCIPHRQPTSSPRRSILGWVQGAARRLGAGIPQLHTIDLDAAERIVAERPLHRDRGGRGVHHPRAAPGQHRGRQVRARRRAARGRGGRQGAAVGVTLGQARRSPPTEQRFPHGERPPVNNPQPAPGGHDQSNAEPRKSSWSPTATASPARPVMAGGRVQPQPTRHPRQGGHHAG